MQVKFHPRVKVRSLGQIPLNFTYRVNFKDVYAKLCVVSHILDIKHV